MQLAGFHHLTAVTAEAARNHAFYTQTLGLRLVKKTVNQDDVSAYHLFYADGVGSPGTDVTFFDWPARRERRGTNSIVRTGLRVGGPASLAWWEKWLDERGVTHGRIAERGGRATLDFDDFEGQRLALVADETPGPGQPWEKSPAPAEHRIRGLGPIAISVPKLEPTDRVLTGLMNMRRVRDYSIAADGAEQAGGGRAGKREAHVYRMAAEGAQGELHLIEEPQAPPASPGAGGVHHMAFRVRTVEEYDAWVERVAAAGMRSSGPVDRYYFSSLYFREPNGILFEIATDGPGFAADEPVETLGERLALPPFLEGRRAEIERGLKPLA